MGGIIIQIGDFLDWLNNLTKIVLTNESELAWWEVSSGV